PELHSFPTRRSSDLGGLSAVAGASPNPGGGLTQIMALRSRRRTIDAGCAQTPSACWISAYGARPNFDLWVLNGSSEEVSDHEVRSEEHTSELQSREN